MIYNTYISLVAAIGENRELGKDNKLPWNLPEDLEHFRTITNGHPIIMGRKTFESIGRVLPNRTNIIVTRDVSFKVNGAMIVHSLKEAIVISRQQLTANYKLLTTNKNEVFIIGGGQIFKEAISFADRLYLTIVHKSFDADTFFPEYKEFSKVVEKEDHKSNGFEYTFFTLEK